MSPFGPATPLFAARDQFQLDDALGTEIDGDVAVLVLPAGGNEDALGLLERGEDVGALHDLVKVRRADFFLALGDQHEVDREFRLGLAHGMKRGQHGGLGSFLIDGAATDDRAAESGLVDDAPFERRRRPFGGIELLDVVHEVQGERALRAVVHRGEDARMTVGRHDRGRIEPCLARQGRHVFGAFLHAAVLGRDGGQRDPVLNPLDGGITTGFRGLADRRIALRCRPCAVRTENQRTGACESRRSQKLATIPTRPNHA